MSSWLLRRECNAELIVQVHGWPWVAETHLSHSSYKATKLDSWHLGSDSFNPQSDLKCVCTCLEWPLLVSPSHDVPVLSSGSIGLTCYIVRLFPPSERQQLWGGWVQASLCCHRSRLPMGKNDKDSFMILNFWDKCSLKWLLWRQLIDREPKSFYSYTKW